jgi:hypothetical protein
MGLLAQYLNNGRLIAKYYHSGLSGGKAIA